ncbi:MAG: methyltransferase domain-containing protein, partial [bacterium]
MIGRETLDDPRAEPAAVRRTLADIARLNALFGGTRAVVEALERFFEVGKGEGEKGQGGSHWTLLDVGIGSGDIARAAVVSARRHDIDLTPLGIELNPTAARAARAGGVRSIVGDGNRLPLGPRSVDVIVASQVLHHLPRAVAVRWIASFDRLARRAVVLADLRRSP